MLFAALGVLPLLTLVAPPKVEIARVPGGEIQPQIAVGDDGTLHLLAFSGEAKAGDLMYRTRGPKDRDWSKPRRVNSEPGAAVAVGNDRGGHLVLGKGGAVHVAWNGSADAKPRPADGTPMLYSRLPAGADAFEPQRNLMTRTGSLDGGGSIAADAKGNVAVVWHALPDDASARNEASRRVFVATSTDEGKSFGAESPRSEPASGACGCCGLRAGYDAQGDLLVLYRASIDAVHRDERLLRIPAAGAVTDVKLDDWQRPGCPMSTAAILPGPTRTLLAWESRGEVRWASLGLKQSAPDSSTAAGAVPSSKYPAIATNKDGYVVLAWTEGMAWNTGGRLHWALYDPKGAPVPAGAGKADGVPAWSLVAVAPTPDGGFLILY